MNRDSSPGTIQVDDVVLRYPSGRSAALDRVSCTLAGGKVHGLLGRNGSGKTSLLSLIAAFRRATSGTVALDGMPVFESTEAAAQVCLIRGGGDTVVHDWPLNRVADALRLARHLRPHWDDDYAMRLVEQFELPPRSSLNDLSRGQRSQLGVTLGLASRCPVTMFDESYIGMDAPSRYMFYEELAAEHAVGQRTFVLSTHLVEEVGTLFDEVAILDEGKLLLHEETEVLRARGASVTGRAETVDCFTEGLTVLSSEQLGPTKRVMVYGELDALHRQDARRSGLDLGPVALQDLFVHLTAPADSGGDS